ncbi:MAG: hypothetical protein HY774_16095 [Acidobacteria bacterium]|nr:hypothetical protein [Acidobacteriota bacterium]
MNTFVVFEHLSHAGMEILLNSLWQAGIVASLAALILRVKPDLSASAKYAVLGTAFVIALALPVTTIAFVRPGILVHSSPTDRQFDTTTSPTINPMIGFPVDESLGNHQPALNPTAGKPDLGSIPAEAIPDRKPLVSISGGSWVGWLAALIGLIQGVFLIRLVWGWRYVHQLRRTSQPLPARVEAQFTETLTQFGAGRPVEIRSSDRVTSPLMIGPGCPIILFPSELISQLSVSELELLLLHELAHVARWDDWAKLAQSLLSALFFFNPAVHWFTRNLELEREIACDDWVLQTRRDHRSYARCLLRLAEMKLLHRTPPVLASGIFSNQAKLSHRIELILNSQRTLSMNFNGLQLKPLIGASLVALMCNVFLAPTFSITLESDPKELTPALSRSQPAQPASRKSPLTEELVETWTVNETTFSLQTLGYVEVEPNKTRIKSISPNGYLILEEKQPASTRRYEFRPLANGKIAESYSLNHVQRPMNGSARKHFVQLLPELVLAHNRALDRFLREEAAHLISFDTETGEVPEIRQVALKALGERAGTVLVMDPNTGRVLSIVNQEWALRTSFTPASTIKLVTGLAGLTTGAIQPEVKVDLPTENRQCDFREAMALSSTAYFQKAGEKVGQSRFLDLLGQFGLGETTGINLAGEIPGKILSDPKSAIPRNFFGAAEGMELTPLQMGSLVSTIANGGTVYTPQLATSTNDFKPIIRRQANLPTRELELLKSAMVDVVEVGTASAIRNPRLSIAGKTGTAVKDGLWTGWFVSYAPAVHPKFAIVVVLQGADTRGSRAAEVAGQIFTHLHTQSGS